MREPLQPYKSHDRINYLCIVATEMLGETSLTRLPALLAGFDGIKYTLAKDVSQALSNIRIAGIAPGTLRELSLMADTYRAFFRRTNDGRSQSKKESADYPQRFEIGDDLSIRKLWTHLVPEDVTLALQALNAPLPVRARVPMALHDPLAPAEISGDAGFGAYISALGFQPEEPPLYNIARSGSPPGFISWNDLVEVAKSFDRIDMRDGRQGEGSTSWFGRLHDLNGNATAHLLKATNDGLAASEGIDLIGIKHLIGLPGAGKTTLLYLLAGYLHQRDHAVCFLFPSIEVASAFIETLTKYEIDVGLLSGQGESARTRHVLNFSSALAGQNNGYAVTRSVAQFFATNCALAGFASDEENEFPHASPPCMKIQQRPSPNHRARPHRCALSGVCGYQYAERSLATKKLWAGHILSMDRHVSRLFSDSDVRHFEFIARTFDLLVVDECDGAQSNLDAQGTPIMKLVGNSDSLWNTLIRDIHQPAATGRNAFVAGETLPTLLEMTGRFGRATERLVGRITHFPARFRSENANLLHTSLSLISDMFVIDKDDETQRKARQALERVWDTALKQVAFRYERANADEDDVFDVDRSIAEATALFGAASERISQFHQQLLGAIEQWERDGNDAAIHEIAKVLRSTPSLTSSLDDETFFAYTGLLTAVSLVVLQHFGLAPHLRLMNSEGLVSDNVFESRPSRDQLGVLPESLVGRLSGVRYIVSEEGNVDVSHVSFAGTPRALPSRMEKLATDHGGNGMAVLLTSATSMLEQSPSFHVHVGPHYVLRRPNAGDGWKRSKYKFLPLMSPQDGKTPLRFSGAKMSHRETILKQIVDELLRGGVLSHVHTALTGNGLIDGIQRKVGFVVNSYDQCELLFRHIETNHPSWRGRVRYLTRASLYAARHEKAITAAEVESLGIDSKWDILIFPMNAIGRGVNIVFRTGPAQNKAMIGSLFFLTRPHPRGDSLQLIQGIVGKASEAFDRQRFNSTEEALTGLRAARRTTTSIAEHLLRIPLVAQTLGEFAEPFVADQMIIILQTIGRAMRGDCPAFVYFVDAAWAPASARGEADSERTSMLVMMQRILSSCLNHPDEAKRDCYRNLYQSFFEPLSAIENLNTSSKTK